MLFIVGLTVLYALVKWPKHINVMERDHENLIHRRTLQLNIVSVGNTFSSVWLMSPVPLSLDFLAPVSEPS